MYKTMKTISMVIVITLPFFIGSCIGKDDVPDRTAAMEQSELNQAITNLQKANYNVDTTELGVFYIINKQGTGTFPQKNDTCFLIYTGFFLNGIIFDSSGDYAENKDSIWQFKYLETSLIPGFNNGISLLNKGAEVDIIIPSNLAYGAAGYGAVPPYTPLVFTLKMKDLKPVE